MGWAIGNWVGYMSELGQRKDEWNVQLVTCSVGVLRLVHWVSGWLSESKEWIENQSKEGLIKFIYLKSSKLSGWIVDWISYLENRKLIGDFSWQ